LDYELGEFHYYLHAFSFKILYKVPHINKNKRSKFDCSDLSNAKGELDIFMPSIFTSHLLLINQLNFLLKIKVCRGKTFHNELFIKIKKLINSYGKIVKSRACCFYLLPICVHGLG